MHSDDVEGLLTEVLDDEHLVVDVFDLKLGQLTDEVEAEHLETEIIWTDELEFVDIEVGADEVDDENGQVEVLDKTDDEIDDVVELTDVQLLIADDDEVDDEEVVFMDDENDDDD